MSLFIQKFKRISKETKLCAWGYIRNNYHQHIPVALSTYIIIYCDPDIAVEYLQGSNNCSTFEISSNKKLATLKTSSTTYRRKYNSLRGQNIINQKTKLSNRCEWKLRFQRECKKNEINWGIVSLDKTHEIGKGELGKAIGKRKHNNYYLARSDGIILRIEPKSVKKKYKVEPLNLFQGINTKSAFGLKEVIVTVVLDVIARKVFFTMNNNNNGSFKSRELTIKKSINGYCLFIGLFHEMDSVEILDFKWF